MVRKWCGTRSGGEEPFQNAGKKGIQEQSTLAQQMQGIHLELQSLLT
jgi:hypothetical protein